MTVLNSVLAGLLLLLGAVWAWYVANRLWQESLSEGAAGGIAAAREMGLVVEMPAWRARRVAAGRIGGELVRVEWRGGVRGPRSVVRVAGRRRVVPLIVDRDSLEAALGATRT